ncbi:UNVERIFIED_CONTAM: hypothetical protein NY603_17480, partial [Bacteroidetes bacterium 56_B9]
DFTSVALSPFASAASSNDSVSARDFLGDRLTGLIGAGESSLLSKEATLDLVVSGVAVRCDLVCRWVSI